MKIGWEIKRLNEIANYFIGLMYLFKDVSDNGMIVLRSSNVQDDKLDLSDIVRVNRPIKDALKVRRGDILMCSRNGSKRLVGKTAVIGDLSEEMTFGTFMTIVRGDTNPYLAWFFRSESFRQQLGVGENTMINQITKYMLDVIQVPIPSRSEQQRIVGILDEAFDGIATAKANAEKNLQNARALFESHLQSVFTERGVGWTERTLAEVSKDFGRGKSKHRPRNAPHLFGGKYPFIQTGDVRNSEHLITEYSQTYSVAGLAQSKLWPRGTLCITIAANIAETGILDFDACFPDSVIGVVVNDDVTSNKFLEYLLQSFKSKLQAQGKGSAQDNINLGTFENQRFPFPPLKDQQAIAAKLDCLREETQHLESVYQQKLAALDDLKKSLLDQAFKGEL